MRSRKKPWTQNELNTNQYLIESPQEHSGRWAELFEHDNPLHLEIGCGKGKFIIESAVKNPEINFIALEKEPTVAASAMRLAREGANPRNLRFFIYNAKDIDYVFGENEIARLYLNFSDPWDNKKKWAKRRLTHRDFLAKYERILNPIEIFLKTDNKVLFDYSISEFNHCGYTLSAVSYDLHNSAYAKQNIVTEYEQRFIEKGQPIYRLEARKG